MQFSHLGGRSDYKDTHRERDKAHLLTGLIGNEALVSWWKQLKGRHSQVMESDYCVSIITAHCRCHGISA